MSEPTANVPAALEDFGRLLMQLATAYETLLDQWIQDRLDQPDHPHQPDKVVWRVTVREGPNDTWLDRRYFATAGEAMAYVEQRKADGANVQPLERLTYTRFDVEQEEVS